MTFQAGHISCPVLISSSLLPRGSQSPIPFCRALTSTSGGSHHCQARLPPCFVCSQLSTGEGWKGGVTLSLSLEDKIVRECRERVDGEVAIIKILRKQSCPYNNLLQGRAPLDSCLWAIRAHGYRKGSTWPLLCFSSLIQHKCIWGFMGFWKLPAKLRACSLVIVFPSVSLHFIPSQRPHRGTQECDQNNRQNLQPPGLQ